MSAEKKVFSYLTKNNVVFTLVPHKTVFTVYDLSRTLDVDLSQVIKTVLVRADRNLHLLVMPASLKINFAKVKKLVSAKKVSLASEKDMKRLLGFAGMMTPFASYHHLPMLVDSGIQKLKKAYFGCGSYTHSIHMTVSAYLHFEKPQLARFTDRVVIAKPKKIAKKKLKKKSASKKVIKKIRRRKK